MALTKEEFNNLKPGDRIEWKMKSTISMNISEDIGTVVGWTTGFTEPRIEIAWDRSGDSSYESLQGTRNMKLIKPKLDRTTWNLKAVRQWS